MQTENIKPESSFVDSSHNRICRYCYLLNDLTPDLLVSKCSNYEELQDYLRLRGREAYLQKRVYFFFASFSL